MAKTALLPQLEDGLADPQGRTDLYGHGLGQSAGPQEGAVGGSEVLDEPAGVTTEDTGMTTGGEVVVQDEGALGVAAEQDTTIRQGQRCPCQGSLGDGQCGRDALDGSPRSFGGDRLGGRPGLGDWFAGGPTCRAGLATRQDSGSVEVAAQDPNDAEDEDPQERQKAQTDHCEGEFTHRWGSPTFRPEDQDRPAHVDPVTVGQSLAGDAVAVDEGAVRRAEVADVGHQLRAVADHSNLGVLPGDSGVVENDVCRVVAPQYRDCGEQRVVIPVDIEPGALSWVAPRVRRRPGLVLRDG